MRAYSFQSHHGDGCSLCPDQPQKGFDYLFANITELFEEKDLIAAQHEAALKSLAAQLEGVASKEQNTQATLAWTESQLQNHKQSIQELHLEIEALKHSTSWRITAPLRKLLRKISN